MQTNHFRCMLRISRYLQISNHHLIHQGTGDDVINAVCHCETVSPLVLITEDSDLVDPIVINTIEQFKTFSFQINALVPNLVARYSNDTEINKLKDIVTEFVSKFKEEESVVLVPEGFDFHLEEFIEM